MRGAACSSRMLRIFLLFYCLSEDHLCLLQPVIRDTYESIVISGQECSNLPTIHLLQVVHLPSAFFVSGSIIRICTITSSVSSPCNVQLHLSEICWKRDTAFASVFPDHIHSSRDGAYEVLCCSCNHPTWVSYCINFLKQSNEPSILLFVKLLCWSVNLFGPFILMFSIYCNCYAYLSHCLSV